ncbi:hypothetical protein niasHT_027172 [Heterodera trifolii]|uniref:Uncharacterized protein n=1 Tax=Heterodera trifolii TaxID=157864 RepID=A0ABD2KT61_9BILA
MLNIFAVAGAADLCVVQQGRTVTLVKKQNGFYKLNRLADKQTTAGRYGLDGNWPHAPIDVYENVFWNGADEHERVFEYAQELKPKGADADWKPSLGALLNLQPLSEQQGGMDTPIEGVTSIYVYLRRAGAFFAPHTENAELFSISLLLPEMVEQDGVTIWYLTL